MPKNQVKTTSQAFRLAAEGLRRAARAPNIHAYEPHSGQKQFHISQAKGRLLIGGNRSGKTVGGIAEDIWWARGKHPYRRVPQTPTRGRICAVDFDYGIKQIIFPILSRLLPLSELKGGHWDTAYNKEEHLLTLANESTIEFKSYEQQQNKFAGTSLHWCHFDEEPPKYIYDECMLRLVDTAGSWWITETPTEGMSWIYDALFLAAKTNPQYDVIQVSSRDNPYIAEAEIEAATVGLTEDEKKMRIGGEILPAGGFVFVKYLSPKNIIDPMIPNKEWLHAASMDAGFNNPTCFLWHAVSPDGVIITYAEHYKSKEIVPYHAAAVHEMNKEIEREPDYYIGDPSIANTDPITGTSVQLEYIDFGIPIMLGTRDKSGSIQRVARYLQGINGVPKWYICRNCEWLLWELPRLRNPTWSHRKAAYEHNAKEGQQEKDDHACDTARYFIASRPEVDDGTEAPIERTQDGLPASTAVGLDRYADEGSLINKPIIDEYLGSEW